MTMVLADIVSKYTIIFDIFFGREKNSLAIIQTKKSMNYIYAKKGKFD